MGFERDTGSAFRVFLNASATADSRIHILTDSDADGLPAAAILQRALRQAGYPDTTAEVRQKFESAWSNSAIERVRLADPDLLIVTDLGSRPGSLLPGVPTLLLDHHRPTGVPPGAKLITAYRESAAGQSALEIPTTGMMAYACAQALLPDAYEQFLWLAAISLLSDLGDKAPFAELAQAKKVYGAGPLREVTALLNAPRRAAQGNAFAALQLLLFANSPKQILQDQDAPVASLRAELLEMKAEVSAALAAARKLPPHFSESIRDETGAGLVAIRMHSACQIHPLVAQQWRSRFPRSIIFGVNTGFRPGWVHFSGRAPQGINLIQLLARHRPEGADEQYGNGHDQAAGGALPVGIWNRFIEGLGFGPELVVEAPHQT